MTTPFEVSMGRLIMPVTQDDHVLGPEAAPVTVVEYGDYECPYCGRAFPILKELLAERPETVRLVFRNFPLTDLHPHAQIAAEFAEAAGARGRFWEAHDWIYTHQSRLDSAQLEKVADTLDPTGGIAEDLRHHAYSERIRHDFIGGIRSGVNGTPSFFINGMRHEGGYSLPELPGRRSTT